MSCDVFVSYSSKDKLVADALVAALEAKNIRCWYAPRDIGPGMDWGRSITRAISSCSVMLLIFSNHSNQSQRVLDEVYYAISEEKTILPFRIENLEPTDAMRLHLASRHWLDAFQPSWKAHIEALISSLSALLVSRDSSVESIKPANISPVPTGKTLDVPSGNKKWNWLWLSALILPILALLVWGMIPDSLLQRALFNQEKRETPQNTPVQTKTSTPTITPSPTPAPTNLPVPDESFEWNEEFDSKVRYLTSDLSPDFNDDFSYDLADWDQLPDGIVRDLGMLRISGSDILLPANHLAANDFMLEFNIEVQHPGNNTANFTVDFRIDSEDNTAKYSFLISLDSTSTENYWAVIKDENTILGNGISPEIEIDEMIGIRIVAIENQFAIYLNNQPLAYFEDASYRNGSLAFTFYNPDNHEANQFTLDNLRYYNLELIGAGKYYEFAQPILAELILTEPDFEDDFSKPLKQWGELPEEFEITDGFLKTVSGEAQLDLSPIWEGGEFPQNYVLRFDFEVEEYVENLPFEIKFRSSADNYYNISHENLNGRDYWAARLVRSNQEITNIGLKSAYLPVNDFSELIFIVQGHQYIIALRESHGDNLLIPEAVFYFENDIIDSGGLSLMFDYPDPVTVLIDNLAFWVLDQDQSGIFENSLIQWLDNTPPDYEDDFTTLNPKWQVRPGTYIEDGYLVLETPEDDLHGSLISGAEFVIELTLKIIGEQYLYLFQMNGDIYGAGGTNFDVQPGEPAGWQISTQDELRFTGETNAFVSDDYNRFRFATAGDKNAVYLNDELLFYFEDQNHDGNFNRLLLGIQQPGTKIYLDHLRFWKLK